MDRKTVDSAVEDLLSLGLVKKIRRHRGEGTRASNFYYVASLLERYESFIGMLHNLKTVTASARDNPEEFY